MRFLISTVVACLLAQIGLAQQEEAARKTLGDAIKAHGGKENILKLRIARIRYTSTVMLPGKGVADITVEDTYQLPRQFKKVTTGTHNGMKVDLTWAVIDGGENWWHMQGDGPAKRMNERRDIETLYRPYLILEQIVFALDNKDVSLKTLGEQKAGKKLQLGVTMTPEVGMPTDLFFDKESGLLARTVHKRKLPEAKQETVQDTYVKDYKMVNGAMLFHRQTSYNDNKRVGEVVITEVKTFEKFDDKVFAAP